VGAFPGVQLLDVFWSIFVLAGIEKVRIVPGITSPIRSTLLHAIHARADYGRALVACRSGRLSRLAQEGALVVGAAVFSHWIFDLIVHRPDLPLYDDQFKVGLGL